MKPSIAVIDSGLTDYMKIKVSSYLVDGITISESGNHEIIDKQIRDENGHGTLCVALLNKYIEAYDLTVIKIIDENGRANGETLLAALKYLKECDVDIVNISLSASIADYSEEIDFELENLSNQGKIILCSQKNNLINTSFPASSRHVYGVKGQSLKTRNEFMFTKGGSIQCIADSTPVILQINNDDYCFFYGNSKATVVMSAFIANKMIATKRKLNHLELEEILEAEAIGREEIVIEDQLICQVPCIDLTGDIIVGLESSLMEYFELDNGQRNILHQSILGRLLGAERCMELLHYITEKLNITCNYENVSIYDFYNIHSLGDAIVNRWNVNDETRI